MSQGNSSSEESVVFLGYIEDGDFIDQEITKQAEGEILPSTSSLDKLQAPWLVNKIGGTPIFPYDAETVKELEDALESMKCKQCKSSCVLILQILSPIDDSPLDRLIQIYSCVKNVCSRHSWFALRSMFGSYKAPESKPELESSCLKLALDTNHGYILTCPERTFFKPFFISVMEEPTGKENFAKNNLEAMKLAARFSDPDLKPAPIEEKYKNLKNYKPPQQPAHLSDLDDFEKFQMEKLYGNDKDMYRFYKRLSRYQSQIIRYDWEGQPLLNSNKIKLNIQSCPSCSAKRKFELQVMSGLINYLEAHADFDKETLDFSSVLIHSCSKNCTSKTFNLEDTFFMPDPDSRIFNKLKQRILQLKIQEKESPHLDEVKEAPEESGGGEESSQKPGPGGPTKSQRSKKKKKKNKK